MDNPTLPKVAYVFDGRKDFELFLSNAIESFDKVQSKSHPRSHVWHGAMNAKIALHRILVVVQNSNLEAHYNES